MSKNSGPNSKGPNANGLNTNGSNVNGSNANGPNEKGTMTDTEEILGVDGQVYTPDSHWIFAVTVQHQSSTRFIRCQS